MTHPTRPGPHKHADALVCEACGVVNHAGRWYWGAPPLAPLHSTLCPACERIRARSPCGTLRLAASFLPYADEIRGMAANAEVAEKSEHPLERVMAVEQDSDGLVITTTGTHMARRIANKLERRFHKQARIRYPAEESVILVDFDA